MSNGISASKEVVPGGGFPAVPRQAPAAANPTAANEKGDEKILYGDAAEIDEAAEFAPRMSVK